MALFIFIITNRQKSYLFTAIFLNDNKSRRNKEKKEEERKHKDKKERKYYPKILLNKKEKKDFCAGRDLTKNRIFECIVKMVE